MISMATKSTPAKAATAPAVDDTPAVADDVVEAPVADPTVCVVNDARCVGKAVNGKVCSYHAVWYDREGNRR